jgi:hypothetical protein
VNGVYSLIHIILKIFIWSGNHKFYIQFLRQLGLQSFRIILYNVNYVFKGLAFETLGPWCKEAIDFINVMGNRLTTKSGDSKSKKLLFGRISLAIQRGNAASTFPDSGLLSEIFVL